MSSAGKSIIELVYAKGLKKDILFHVTRYYEICPRKLAKNMTYFVHSDGNVSN